MSYEYMSGFGLGDAVQDAAAFKTNQYRLRSEAFKKFGQATSSIGDPCSPPQGGFIRKVHANIPQTPEEIPAIEAQMKPILAAGCQPTGRMWDIYKAEMCCPQDTPKITYLFPLPAGFQPPVAPTEIVQPPAVMQTASPVVPVVLSPGATGHVQAFLPPTVAAPPVEQTPPISIAPDELDPESPPPPQEQMPMDLPVETMPGEEIYEDELPPMPLFVPNGNGAQITNGNGAAAEKMYFGLTQTQLLIAGIGGAAALYFLVLKK